MFLGIDLGASALKVSICDTQGVYKGSAQYPIATLHPCPGACEQRPQDWVHALTHACLTLQNHHGKDIFAKIDAIAVSGGAHICVLMDAEGKILRNAILWSDQRATPQADELATHYGDTIFAKTGNTIQATWSLAILRRLAEHEPEVLQKTHAICMAKDYLRMTLSDNSNTKNTWITDTSDAMGTMLATFTPLSTHTATPNTHIRSHGFAWDKDLLDMAGIHASILPPIRLSSDQCGTTSGKFAQSIGFRVGTRIFCGSIDTSSELLTLTGNTAPILKIASAGVWYRLTNTPLPKRNISLYPDTLGSWYYASGINNCAAALTWLAGIMYQHNMHDLDTDIHHILQTFLCHTTSQKQNVMFAPICHPYLQGERAPLWNSTIRANIGKIDITHQRAELGYAMIEGIAFALRHCREIQDLHGKNNIPKKQPAEIALIGGLQHIKGFVRVLSMVLGSPCKVYPQSDASIGSALLAGYASGTITKAQIAQNAHYRIIGNDSSDAIHPFIEQRYQIFRDTIASL